MNMRNFEGEEGEVRKKLNFLDNHKERFPGKHEWPHAPNPGLPENFSASRFVIKEGDRRCFLSEA